MLTAEVRLVEAAYLVGCRVMDSFVGQMYQRRRRNNIQS
jgi:hypothetical protein